MPVQIACPTCQRQLRVPDNLVGQMVKCPSCQNTFVASLEEGPAPKSSSGAAGSFDFQEEARTERRSARDERIENEERRPSRRRSRDDDDDFDDSPRSRRRNYEPHRGTVILILGILSLVGTGMLTGIPAWIMGNSDLAKMRAGTMDPEGESNTNIGRILGMVSTIMGVIGCGCGCIWFTVMMAAGAAR